MVRENILPKIKITWSCLQYSSKNTKGLVLYLYWSLRVTLLRVPSTVTRYTRVVGFHGYCPSSFLYFTVKCTFHRPHTNVAFPLRHMLTDGEVVNL